MIPKNLKKYFNSVQKEDWVIGVKLLVDQCTKEYIISRSRDWPLEYEIIKRTWDPVKDHVAIIIYKRNCFFCSRSFMCLSKKGVRSDHVKEWLRRAKFDPGNYTIYRL